MPTYEYECKSCGYAFEVFQSMKDDPLKDCPECGKEVRRIINGGSGVIFKGSGFYVTDKNKNSTKTSPKHEGKPDAPKTGEKKESAPCASCPAAAASGGSCPSEKAAG
jgi:putative FmdB family regulatory protein